MSRDQIYVAGSEGKPFEFSPQVVEVFEDMIRRSVPGYGLTLTAIQSVAGDGLLPDLRVYDLGCSLGAGVDAVWQGVMGKARRMKSRPPKLEIIGVDNSEAMVERARGLVGQREGITIELGDATTWPMESAGFIILNFTLQFVPLSQREALLRRCYEALEEGGVLFLSEKFVSLDESDEAWLRELHWEFKRQQGYSELEIASKREALEDVLVPESLAEHERRLRKVGFSQVTRVLQCLNFASWVVRK